MIFLFIFIHLYYSNRSYPYNCSKLQNQDGLFGKRSRYFLYKTLKSEYKVHDDMVLYTASIQGKIIDQRTRKLRSRKSK